MKMASAWAWHCSLAYAWRRWRRPARKARRQGRQHHQPLGHSKATATPPPLTATTLPLTSTLKPATPTQQVRQPIWTISQRSSAVRRTIERRRPASTA